MCDAQVHHRLGGIVQCLSAECDIRTSVLLLACDDLRRDDNWGEACAAGLSIGLLDGEAGRQELGAHILMRSLKRMLLLQLLRIEELLQGTALKLLDSLNVYGINSCSQNHLDAVPP